MIKDSLLDKLIASGRIVKFYRSTGWVFIGRDKIRDDGGNYEGEKQREKEAAAA